MTRMFFDTSPFYYDPIEKCRFVRSDVTTDEDFTIALDVIDEDPNRTMCAQCRDLVGWVAGKWMPCGLVRGGRGPMRVLCPSCFYNSEGTP